MSADPNVLELYEYNAGRQWTHLAVASSTGYPTFTWHDRPTACGKIYPNRRKLVADDQANVDCPSCLRALEDPPSQPSGIGRTRE